MKYKYLMLFLLCLLLQSKAQTVASTIDNTSNPAEHKEGGIIKAQDGGSANWTNDPTYKGLSYADALNKRYYNQARKNREQQQKAEQEAKAAQINFLRVAILTYGTGGIVVLFIIITIVTFSVLYVRRNKDNPIYHKP